MVDERKTRKSMEYRYISHIRGVRKRFFAVTIDKSIPEYD